MKPLVSLIPLAQLNSIPLFQPFRRQFTRQTATIHSFTHINPPHLPNHPTIPTLSPLSITPPSKHLSLSIFSNQFRQFSTQERLRKLTKAQYQEHRRKTKQKELDFAPPKFILFGWIRVGHAPVRRMTSKDIRTSKDLVFYQANTSKWEKFVDSLHAPTFRNAALIFSIFGGMMGFGLLFSIFIEWWFEPGTKPGWWSRSVAPEIQLQFEEQVVKPLQGSVSQYADRHPIGDGDTKYIQIFKDGKYINIEIAPESQHLGQTTLEQMERLVHYDDFMLETSKPKKIQNQTTFNLDEHNATYIPDIFSSPSTQQQIRAQQLLDKLPPLPKYPTKSPGVAFTDAEMAQFAQIKEMEKVRDQLLHDILGKNQILVSRARHEIDSLYAQEQALLYLESQQALDGNTQNIKIIEQALAPENSVLSSNYWLEAFRLKPKHDAISQIQPKGRWPGELDRAAYEFVQQQMKYIDQTELKELNLSSSSSFDSVNNPSYYKFNSSSPLKFQDDKSTSNKSSSTVFTPEQQYIKQRQEYGKDEYYRNLQGKSQQQTSTATHAPPVDEAQIRSRERIQRKRTQETDITSMVDQLYEHYTYDQGSKK